MQITLRLNHSLIQAPKCPEKSVDIFDQITYQKIYEKGLLIKSWLITLLQILIEFILIS